MANLHAISKKQEAPEGEKHMCEYCENYKQLGLDGSGDGIVIERDKERGLAGIGSDSWEFLINYCPMCGEKLNGEPTRNQ